jgi:hypothetical protein
MNKEFYKTPTSIGAALAIIGFLLPWVSLGPFGSISGYDIPKVAEMFSGMASIFNRGEVSSGSQFYYILYLIPLLSAYLLYGEYNGSKKFFAPAKIIIFLLSAFVVYKLDSLGNGSIFEKAGIGLWITVGGSIYLLIKAIKEFQTSPAITTTEDENQTSESGLLNKKMFDLAAIQAQAKQALKLSPRTKKIVIASTAIIILSVGLYFILHKNSYQKTISALENHNWEEVLYYYEKTNFELNNNKLELNFDETKKLQMAYSIAIFMKQINSLRKEFYSTDKSTIENYGSFYDRFANISTLGMLEQEEEAKVLDIDLKKILQPAIQFSDSVMLGYADLFVNDSLISKVSKKETIVNIEQINKNIDILLGGIIDTEKNKLRIKSIKDKAQKLEILQQKNISDLEKEIQEATKNYYCNDSNKDLSSFISEALSKLSITAEIWNKIYETYKKEAQRNDFYCIEKTQMNYKFSTESGVSICYEIDSNGNLLNVEMLGGD